MKRSKQVIAEYRLACQSKTLKPRLIKSQYRYLLRQSVLTQDCEEPLKFLQQPLYCFHVPSVLSLYREIFVYQHYNPPTLLPNQPTILDVGGNIGLFSIYISQLYPQAKVLTFEADPETYAALEKNIAPYQQQQDITLHNVALTDAPGEVEIFSNKQNPNRCTHSIIPGMLSSTEQSESHKVTAARLSDYCVDLDRIDFLKMDIEGAEFPVIKDLYEAQVLPKVSGLILEVHRHAFENPDNDFRLSDLMRILEESEFSIDFFAQGQRPFSTAELNSTFMLRAYRKTP